MFLKVHDKIINLENVNNVHVIPNKNRVIFNMNYSVFIKANDGKLKNVSDYVYADYDTAESVSELMGRLRNSEYFDSHFISGADDNTWINLSEVSSVKFLNDKNRAVFNMSHPVSFVDRDGNHRVTSEFVYVSLKNEEMLCKYAEYVRYCMSKRMYSTQDSVPEQDQDPVPAPDTDASPTPGRAT